MIFGIVDLGGDIRTRQFSKMELFAREAVEGFLTGRHKSPFHGFSVEFAEHRLYNAGESTRHIDWKLFGRTDKMFVKRYEEETNLRCQLVIDHSSSMFYPKGEKYSKIAFSAYAAASLAHLLRTQRDAIGLSTFTDGNESYLPARLSNNHMNYLYESLNRLVEPSAESVKTDIASALHEIAERVHQRSLVVVFTDLFEGEGKKGEELFSALQHLRYNKHDVVLFHVVDEKAELKLDLDNRPTTFVDLETGELIKLNPSSVEHEYRKLAEKYFHEIEIKCGQYHIDYVRADIDKGFEQVLRAYLLKRKKILS